jgi:hypothetical protein
MKKENSEIPVICTYIASFNLLKRVHTLLNKKTQKTLALSVSHSQCA